MKKIKSFSSFHTINEGFTDYITDITVRDEDALMKLLSDNTISIAFSDFAKKYGIDKILDNIPNVRVSNKSSKIYIELADNNVVDLGAFKNAIKKCSLSFFPSGSSAYYKKDGIFYFKPYIWTAFNLRYSLIDGGFNGMRYLIDPKEPRSGELCYDILEGKWYQTKEYESKWTED